MDATSITQPQEAQELPPRKSFGEMEFPIFPTIEIITREKRNVPSPGLRAVGTEHPAYRKHSLKFGDQQIQVAWGFCREILIGIAESAEFNPPMNVDQLTAMDENDMKIRERIKSGLVRLLEEKFGMKVSE